MTTSPSASSRLSVLYLTNNLPVPPTSGGQLREFQLLRRLKTRFDVHLIAFVQDAEHSSQSVQDALKFLSSVTLVAVEQTSAAFELPPRIWAHYAPTGKEVVARLLDRISPDLIHVEGYFLAYYLPEEPCLPLVLTEENIEFDLEAGGERYGYYREGDSRRTQAWEIPVWRRADRCITVTPEDADVIRTVGGRDDVVCIPCGMDHLNLGAYPQPCNLGADTRFLYVANYGWQPSQDAARYLVRDVWPMLRGASPNLQLVLAGVDMPDDLLEEASRTRQIIVHGPFEAFSDVARLASVFLFPLRFGGGQKVKLIEAITAGLAIVTTSSALRGFPDELVSFVSVAEGQEQFVAAALDAMYASDRFDRAAMARDILLRHLPRWDDAAESVSRVWSGCLSRRDAFSHTSKPRPE